MNITVERIRLKILIYNTGHKDGDNITNNDDSNASKNMLNIKFSEPCE